MKAMILAGGLGSRLGKYTKDLPKGMLEFMGKTIIQRQIELFKSCGISEIIITRKHLKEKINYPDVKYDDKDQDDSNMVADFMHARYEFNDDIILSYGDVLYEPRVLKQLMESKADISVVADSDWKDYWILRNGSVQEDSESFEMNNDKLISLGMPNPPLEKMHARYVGLIKFSKKILPSLTKIYDELSEEIGFQNPWRYSKTFKKAYMTDLIQEMIDRKFDVRVVNIKRGWIEFDTEKDYEIYLDLIKKDELKKFISLDNPQKV